MAQLGCMRLRNPKGQHRRHHWFPFFLDPTFSLYSCTPDLTDAFDPAKRAYRIIWKGRCSPWDLPLGVCWLLAPRLPLKLLLNFAIPTSKINLHPLSLEPEKEEREGQ